MIDVLSRAARPESVQAGVRKVRVGQDVYDGPVLTRSLTGAPAT